MPSVTSALPSLGFGALGLASFTGVLEPAVELLSGAPGDVTEPPVTRRFNLPFRAAFASSISTAA
jgi:hypothetical protein